jgi:DNA-binding Xre family transcriptional regulator
MLKLQIKELFELRGIKTPLVAMKKAGISHAIGHNYLSGKKKNLTLRNIEILCTLLRCTPNDLFVWTPDNESENYEGHPLQKLRPQALPELHKVISHLSIDEVKKRLEG